MEYFKKAIVYYRDYPAALENYVMSDSLMSFVKDGSLMCKTIGKKMPRITIFLKPLKDADSHNDRRRVLQLDQHLAGLIKTNQIISYTIL